MPRKTPQQKKAQSYAKDRRNDYGEGNKSSRKAIRKRKRKPNRADRRAAHQVIRAPVAPSDVEALDRLTMDVAAPSSKRRMWEKVPDTPLADFVEERLKRRVQMGIDDVASADRKIARVRQSARSVRKTR